MKPQKTLTRANQRAPFHPYNRNSSAKPKQIPNPNTISHAHHPSHNHRSKILRFLLLFVSINGFRPPLYRCLVFLCLLFKVVSHFSNHSNTPNNRSFHNSKGPISFSIVDLFDSFQKEKDESLRLKTRGTVIGFLRWSFESLVLWPKGKLSKGDYEKRDLSVKGVCVLGCWRYDGGDSLVWCSVLSVLTKVGLLQPASYDMISSCNWEACIVQSTKSSSKKKNPIQNRPRISFLYLLILILSLMELSLNNDLVQLNSFPCKLLNFKYGDDWFITKFITLNTQLMDPRILLISFITSLISNLPVNSKIFIQYKHQSDTVDVSEYDGTSRSLKLAITSE